MTQLVSPDITSTPDRERAVATLVTAFSADPVIRWLYPSPHDYLAHFPVLVDRLAGGAFEAGTAHGIGEMAAALWLPPGVQSDEEGLGALFQSTIPEERQGTVWETLERLGGYHPAEPHWYLPVIGVDPANQGQGFGSALLAHALKRCDESGEPAYLESSNVRNLPLYERHGFEVIEELRVGAAPPLWPMIRTPR